MRLKNSERGWDAGATAVETALVVSVLMLLLLGTMGFGYALWQWNTMMLAVQEAGRSVMINNACSAACAVNRMQTILTSASPCINPAAGQICVSAATNLATTPPTMTLTSAYNFNLFALIPAFTMTTQTVVPLD